MIHQKELYIKEILENRPSEMIVTGIEDSQLDERLKHQLKEKIIRSEQWFRDHNNWYGITSSINPYKTINSEVEILYHYKKQLSKLINNTVKVFWGIGNGDSEIFPVIWDLEENFLAEINIIDINRYFIDGFILSLINLNKDYPKAKILFAGNVDLFEKIQKIRVQPVNSKNKVAAHICFGDIIGSFEENEIFNIFKRNSNKGDFLVLGYHLLIDPKRMLNIYENSPKFERFIMEPINRIQYFNGSFSSILKRLKGVELKWRYNPETTSIEAQLNDILLFRSKKYDPNNLKRSVEKYGFSHIATYTEGATGISLFKVE